MNWLDPRPFLRGVAWLDDGRPVRADPADLARLPWDTAERAALPIGVRLEFTAEGAQAVEIRYRASVPRADRRSAGARPLLRPLAGRQLCLRDDHRAGRGGGRHHPAPHRIGRAVHDPSAGGPVPRDPGPARRRRHPHARTPRSLAGWSTATPSPRAGGPPAPPTPGPPPPAGYSAWTRSTSATRARPGANWPSRSSSRHLPADVITLAFGTNCWTGIPFSAPLLYETTRAFLALVRQGHPDTPLLLVSPVLRPEAEQTPNRLGATLAELRTAMEQAVRDRMRRRRHRRQAARAAAGTGSDRPRAAGRRRAPR